MYGIDIYRNNVVITSLPLLAGTFTKRLMAEHNLVFNFATVAPIEIQIGDKLTYKNEVMTINNVPEVKRDHKLEYTFVFEGVRHNLERFLLRDEGALTFDYLNDLHGFMFMFLESLNSVDSGWTLGEVEDVEPFAVSFDKVDHFTALNMICEGAKCEWQMKGKEMSIKKTVGKFRNYPLSYGKDNGLYSITRKRIENGRIVTRAYAVGGSNNLPASYPYKEFTMDGYKEDPVAIQKYGLREGAFKDEEIYPKRTGAVTEVTKINDNQYTISDSSIDFDMNSLRIDGQDIYIIFKSGMLNGQQFKVLSYAHTSKTIRYEANKDNNGNLVPFGATLAAVGDKYTLIGLRMPQSYINAAKAELEAKCLEYLNSNKVPRVVYEAPLDPLDLKRNGVEIEEGDILPFSDTKIGLNEDLRVTSVSYKATFPDFLPQGMVFTAEIGQEVTYTRIQKVENEIRQTKQVVTQRTTKSIEEDRKLAMRMRQLQDLVFDADGYFDGTRIKPNSIETLMLSVGAKSQNFLLNGVTIEVNSGDDPKHVIISAGQLVHLEVRIEGIGYIWNMSQLSKNDLVPNVPYYVSARCSTIDLIGTWHLSQTPVGTEDEHNFYHFNVGVIYAESEGRRDYSFTSGMTYIHGAQIKTGQIDAARLNVQEIVVNGGGATVSQMNEAKQQAIQAANAYSEANDELLQIVAESYADGLVSAEEQARINDATQKLLEAKQHADAAAGSALQSAKGYADSLISALGELAHEDLVEIAKLGTSIIQGGYIKTDIIDVVALFAQQITAQNLNVAGNSTIGPFSIIPEGLYVGSDPFGQIFTKQVAVRKDGLSLLYMDKTIKPVQGTAGIDMYSLSNVLCRLYNNTCDDKQIAHQYDMGDTNTAIDVVSGKIRVDGYEGYTGKFTVANTASTTQYYHFRFIKGLLVNFVQNTSPTNPL